MILDDAVSLEDFKIKNIKKLKKRVFILVVSTREKVLNLL